MVCLVCPVSHALCSSTKHALKWQVQSPFVTPAAAPVRVRVARDGTISIVKSVARHIMKHGVRLEEPVEHHQCLFQPV